MIEFHSSHMLSRHVSDLSGPSSGAFVCKLYVQICYVVIRVLFNMSSPYEVICTLRYQTPSYYFSSYEISSHVTGFPTDISHHGTGHTSTGLLMLPQHGQEN